MRYQKIHTVNDYTAKTSVELGEADRLTVYENGIRTTADAIKQGSVIAVAKSADSSVILVQILDGLVTGEITSLSSGTMTISGTKYNISPSYAGDALKVGRGGSFYFDNYGRIVRCVGLKEASSQYVYLLNFYRGDDPNGDCFAEILTAEGTRETFTVKQSVNVNGEKCNLGTALQRIEKNQLVTYKVSSDKRITKINTANKSYIGRDTATEIFSMHFKGAGKYRKNNMCFNSKYLLDSTTPIFVIPYNEDKYDYTVAEVVWAVREEMAREVEDVLARRVRLLFVDAREAIKAAPLVAEVMAKELGKDQAWIDEEVKEFTELAGNYIAAKIMF